MARESERPPLSNEQKQKVCLYLSAGCDRESAAKLVRCSLWDIRCAMQFDAAFGDEVRHAEGASELAHVRNVQNAAQDVKNWRASVWWLERRSPERFGRRAAGTVTTRQLKAFVAQLVAMVVEEMRDADDRRRLLERFDQLVTTLDQLVFEDTELASDSAGPASTPISTNANEDDMHDVAGNPLDLDDELA
jgi:hypothetical protein